MVIHLLHAIRAVAKSANKIGLDPLTLADEFWSTRLRLSQKWLGYYVEYICELLKTVSILE